MQFNFLAGVKKVELMILRAAIMTGQFLAAAYHRVVQFLQPKWQKYSRIGIVSLAVLYVIGAIVFGVRLYVQRRFAPIDRYASYIYPFPVAHAGRSLIFARTLERQIAWTDFFAQKMQKELPSDLDQQILDDKINDAVTMQEADRMGIKVTEKDIDARLQESIEGIGGQEQLESFFRENYNMSIGQFKANLMLPKVALEKIRDERFVRVKARHILIKDDKKAEEILKKIQDGGNFADLAKDNSEDQGSKDDGGLLAGGDFIYRDSGLVPEVEAALFALKAGETSGIVKSSLGNHILRVEERQGTIDKTTDGWLSDLRQTYRSGIWI